MNESSKIDNKHEYAFVFSSYVGGNCLRNFTLQLLLFLLGRVVALLFLLRLVLDKLPRVGDGDSLGSCSTLAAKFLDGEHDFFPEQHAPEHHMFAVEPTSHCRGDEELRAVRVGARVGHLMNGYGYSVVGRCIHDIGTLIVFFALKKKENKIMWSSHVAFLPRARIFYCVYA